MDEETELLVSQIKALLKELRAKGVAEDQIDTLVRKDRGPGRIILDRGTLVLPDEGQARIRLTPMERTLYILLLRHADGVAAEEMWRYWDELYEIYGTQTVYDDPDMIADSVDAICEDDRAALHTNISRIKKKIADKAGDWAAREYGIRRGTDGRYRITVPRDKVMGLA